MPDERPSRPYPRVQTDLDTSGGANPADAAGADINTIVAQYRKNGTLPAVNVRQPLYGDFTGPQELHDQREAVFAAQEHFNSFPADVRDLCDNDMENYLKLMETPEGREKLEAAGLELFDAPISDPETPSTSESPQDGDVPTSSDPTPS